MATLSTARGRACDRRPAAAGITTGDDVQAVLELLHRGMENPNPPRTSPAWQHPPASATSM